MTLTELQQQLAAQKLDACIITRNNQFLGQDILPEENRLQRLTGFSGSAGNLLVFRDRAFLFTDGRYELQAARETDPEQVEVVITNGQSLGSWLQNHTESQKLRIAFNPWCHTVSETDFWKRTLKNIEFVEDAGLLSAALLSAKECNIFEHDIEFAGISMDEKIADLTEFMRQNKLDAFLLTACDSVSWLLNLRSDCLPDTPIVRAFAFINALGEVSLFTTDFTKLESELKNYKNRTVGMDCKRSPRALFSLMKKHKIWIENLPDPVQNRKAVKNPVEISGLRKAHLRDGAAVVRLLIWLEQNYNGQLQIELREEVAQGTYANLAIITHSSSEFILDFVRVMPGIPKAGVQSRIIVAPEHAKRLLRALEDNIAKYERVFGPIRTSDEPSLPPLTGVKGEA